MAKREVSREHLAALAALLGLQLDDTRLELLRPAYQRLLDGVDDLGTLDLRLEDPATTFRPKGG